MQFDTILKDQNNINPFMFATANKCHLKMSVFG